MDGNLWVTANDGVTPTIARITPSGQITEFPLDIASFPRGIAAGPDGNIYFANGYTVGKIVPGAPPPARLYTVAPCRVVDTRNATGPLGGPGLNAGSARTFVIAGHCGIPATAKAISANITVTLGTTAGFLTLFPSGSTRPAASSINFLAGQTRANNAVIQLGASGDVNVFAGMAAGNATHFILDLNGYFQ
ncbi:MAG TPA: hypothetical protein VKJ00_11230 [Thermoanaerobaculia bacterium]|nr:hypothetical protein [Thermoanaerobaculia bacterium]